MKPAFSQSWLNITIFASISIMMFWREAEIRQKKRFRATRAKFISKSNIVEFRGHLEGINCELPDFQAGFRKGRGTRDQIANIHWIMEKAREFLSHPCMTTGKNIALTRWTFVSKVMSLLFNMLSRLVITFLPGRKHLLISWLQSL